LGEPEEVTQATNEYKEEMDTLAAFLSERCVIEAGASEGATDLFDAYKEWCTDTNETAGTQKVFGGKLGERGFEKKRSKAGMVYQGIRLMRSELISGGCRVNGGEPKPGIDGHASHSHEVNQKTIHHHTHPTPKGDGKGQSSHTAQEQPEPTTEQVREALQGVYAAHPDIDKTDEVALARVLSDMGLLAEFRWGYAHIRETAGA
jgi:phage/plasmid-associated DNA primase